MRYNYFWVIILKYLSTLLIINLHQLESWYNEMRSSLMYIINKIHCLFSNKISLSYVIHLFNLYFCLFYTSTNILYMQYFNLVNINSAISHVSCINPYKDKTFLLSHFPCLIKGNNFLYLNRMTLFYHGRSPYKGAYPHTWIFWSP